MKLVTLENNPDSPWSMAAMLHRAGYHCRGYDTASAFTDSPWVKEADLAIIDSDSIKLDKRLAQNLAEIFWPDRKMLLIGRDERRSNQLTRDGNTFLVRPVSARELIACVKDLLSTMCDGYATTAATQFGRYLFEPSGRSVLIGDKRVSLTHKEYQLALILFRNLRTAVSRVYLAGTVWQHDERINARTMTAHICAIRSKLQLRSDADFVVTPIYNYGYRLDPARRYRSPSPVPSLPANSYF